MYHKRVSVRALHDGTIVKIEMQENACLARIIILGAIHTRCITEKMYLFFFFFFFSWKLCGFSEFLGALSKRNMQHYRVSMPFNVSSDDCLIFDCFFLFFFLRNRVLKIEPIKMMDLVTKEKIIPTWLHDTLNDKCDKFLLFGRQNFE